MKKVGMFLVLFPFLTLLYVAGLCVALVVSILSLLAAPMIVWRLITVWFNTKELQNGR